MGLSLNNRFRQGILALGALTLVSCTGGGGGVSVSGIGNFPSGSASLSVTNVYPSSESAAFSTPQASGRYHVKGLLASIRGTCARGIATIQVTNGTPYTETASCQADGTFTWSRTFTSGEQGNATWTLSALDAGGSVVAGATATVNVNIDNTAPATPGLVTPSSSPFTLSGAAGNITIQLSGAPDVVSMTGPAGAALTFTGGNYEYPAVVADGATVIYTFYAYDLAGNQSVGRDVQITFVPSLDVRISGNFLGGPVLDGVSNYTLESTVTSVSPISVDAGTSFSLLTGFNYITNQARIP